MNLSDEACMLTLQALSCSQIPTLVFLYIAGYIGYVGRDYLTQVCVDSSLHMCPTFCLL